MESMDVHDRLVLFDQLKQSWRKNDAISGKTVLGLDIKDCQYWVKWGVWRKDYEHMVKGQLVELFEHLDDFKLLLKELSTESVECNSDCDTVCVTDLCDEIENHQCMNETVNCSPVSVLRENNLGPVVFDVHETGVKLSPDDSGVLLEFFDWVRQYYGISSLVRTECLSSETQLDDIQKHCDLYGSNVLCRDVKVNGVVLPVDVNSETVTDDVEMYHEKVDLLTSETATVLGMGYNSRLDVVGLSSACRPTVDSVRSPKLNVNCKSLHYVTMETEELCSVDCAAIECIDDCMGSVELSVAAGTHGIVIQYNQSTCTLAGHVENFRRVGVG